MIKHLQLSMLHNSDLTSATVSDRMPPLVLTELRIFSIILALSFKRIVCRNLSETNISASSLPPCNSSCAVERNSSCSVFNYFLISPPSLSSSPPSSPPPSLLTPSWGGRRERGRKGKKRRKESSLPPHPSMLPILTQNPSLLILHSWLIIFRGIPQRARHNAWFCVLFSLQKPVSLKNPKLHWRLLTIQHLRISILSWHCLSKL